MIMKLEESERLVYAGETALRAPDGTALPPEPMYMIVSADSADPTVTSELGDDECLVQIGVMQEDLKAARKRYDDLMAGIEPEAISESIPLYVKESINNVDSIIAAEKAAINEFAKLLAAEYKRQHQS